MCGLEHVGKGRFEWDVHKKGISVNGRYILTTRKGGGMGERWQETSERGGRREKTNRMVTFAMKTVKQVDLSM